MKTLCKYLLRIPARAYATDYFACGEYPGRWMFGNRLFDAGKVFVLPNAIKPSVFAFSTEARRETRAMLGLEDSCFVVGHTGRFVYQKNHNFLLDIFVVVKRENPQSILLVIGEGPLQKRIEKKAERLGIASSVIFAGTQDTMGPYYSAMDCLLLPSFYEGIPITAVEAQANGLPCLLADTVSSEVVFAENALRLSLKQGAAVWAKTALQGTRRPGGELPDAFNIAVQAEKLRSAYQRMAQRGRPAPALCR
jgi:glycosyltransferase EpsF